MNVTADQAKKIMTGNQKFTQLGFSMLITRLRGSYAKDSSPGSLNTYTGEINAFLKKFNSIMGADYAVIAKL